MFKIRRALISVSDKRGLTAFAQGLHAMGIEILSTGGTCRQLREAGIPAIEVSDKTGFPEIMGGRVKTLHPVIHGGLLGRRGQDDAVMVLGHDSLELGHKLWTGLRAAVLDQHTAILQIVDLLFVRDGLDVHSPSGQRA